MRILLSSNSIPLATFLPDPSAIAIAIFLIRKSLKNFPSHATSYHLLSAKAMIKDYSIYPLSAHPRQ